MDIQIEKKIFLWQIIYLKKILKCFQILKWKPVLIFINLRVANSLVSSQQQVDKTTIKWYQLAIGFLI